MVQLVGLTIISAVIILYLRSINNEFALLATVGASILILSYAIKYVSEAYTIINKLIELTGVDRSLYAVVFKITAIGYLVEFGADIVLDFGLKALADKLVFTGKILIFTTSIPILYAILNLFTGLLS